MPLDVQQRGCQRSYERAERRNPRSCKRRHVQTAPQAKDWGRHAVAYVLGLDIDDEVQKKQISLITKALFKEGLLAKVEERDPEQRKTMTFRKAV